MIGFAYFLVPMLIAYCLMARRHGHRQAIINLLGFNLLFDFDFGALMPGGFMLPAVLVLLGIFVVTELLAPRYRGTTLLGRRHLTSFVALGVFAAWMTVVVCLNKMADWGIPRSAYYGFRQFGAAIAFFVVGARLARGGSIGQFFASFTVGCAFAALVGIVQTFSQGTLLTSNTGANYLGIFQPLPGRALDRRDVVESADSFVAAVRTISFGGVSFYRGWGPYDGAVQVYANCGLILLVMLLNRTSMNTTAAAVMFGTIVIGVVASFYRVGLVTFFGLLVWIFVVKFQRPSRLVAVFAPIVLVLLIAIAMSPSATTAIAAQFDGLFGERARRETDSLNGRLQLWTVAAEDIGKSPLWGTGQTLTSYRAGWSQLDDPDIDISAHSTVLEYMYRAGVPAGVAYLACVFATLRKLRLLFRHKSLDRTARAYFEGMFYGFLYIFISGLTASMQSTIQVGAFAWLIIGYVLTYRLSQPSQRKTETNVGSLAYAM
jgi:O-antigen ligase